MVSINRQKVIELCFAIDSHPRVTPHVAKNAKCMGAQRRGTRAEETSSQHGGGGSYSQSFLERGFRFNQIQVHIYIYIYIYII